MQKITMKGSTFSEAQIQRTIIKWLESDGWYVVKLIQTNKNGIPDLMIAKHGKVYMVEVKSENGHLSALQEVRIEQLVKSGVYTFVVKSLEQLKPYINAINKEFSFV